jgi:hypothetical protein
VTARLQSYYANCANGDNNGNGGADLGAGADFNHRRSIVTKIIQHLGLPNCSYWRKNTRITIVSFSPNKDRQKCGGRVFAGEQIRIAC